MSYDYEAELAAWRERMAAKPCARYVRLADGFVRRPARQPLGLDRVEYDTDADMPRYEDFSQEAA